MRPARECRSGGLTREGGDAESFEHVGISGFDELGAFRAEGGVICRATWLGHEFGVGGLRHLDEPGKEFDFGAAEFDLHEVRPEWLATGRPFSFGRP